MRELIPLLGLLEDLTPALQLNKDQPAVYWEAYGYDKNNGSLSANLFEDNAGAYELQKLPKCDPEQSISCRSIITFRNMYPMAPSESILLV